jgi:Flp pilus assembly protein TadD, contains TPR repeats
VAVLGEDAGSHTALLGTDPKDDLSLGKHHFRQENFGLAEHYFRRAAESHPRDAEAWLGLAASYDRLRRFELADRAYKQVIAIAGVTPEVLNNQGYSLILRGDYARARTKLAEARALDPKSPFILNNIKLLEESSSKRKAVQ